MKKKTLLLTFGVGLLTLGMGITSCGNKNVPTPSVPPTSITPSTSETPSTETPSTTTPTTSETPSTSVDTSVPSTSEGTTTPDSSEGTTTPDSSEGTTTPDSSEGTTTPDSSVDSSNPGGPTETVVKLTIGETTVDMVKSEEELGENIEEEYYVLDLDVKKGEKLTFKVGDTVLKEKLSAKEDENNNVEGKGENLVVRSDGTSTIKLSKDKNGNYIVFASGYTKPAPVEEVLTIKVNNETGVVTELEKRESDKFAYSIELAIDDVVTLDINGTALKIGEADSFKATKDGVHKIYVKTDNSVEIVEPVVEEKYQVRIGAGAYLEFTKNPAVENEYMVTSQNVAVGQSLSFKLGTNKITVAPKDDLNNNIDSDLKIKATGTVDIYLQVNGDSYTVFVTGYEAPETRLGEITQEGPEKLATNEAGDFKFTVTNKGNVAYEDTLQIRFQGTNENETLKLSEFKIGDKVVEATPKKDGEKFLGYDILINVPVKESVTITAKGTATEANEYVIKTVTSTDTSASLNLNVFEKGYKVTVDGAATEVTAFESQGNKYAFKVTLTEGQKLVLTHDGTPVELGDQGLTGTEFIVKVSGEHTFYHSNDGKLYITQPVKLDKVTVTIGDKTTELTVNPDNNKELMLNQLDLVANQELVFKIGEEVLPVEVEGGANNVKVTEDGKLVVAYDAKQASIYLKKPADKYILFVSGYPTTTHESIYFKPAADWLQGEERFAGYVFGNGNAWFDLTETEKGSGVYTGTLPKGEWTTVIFCRMNKDNKDNNWDNKIAQTGNVVFVEDDLYIMEDNRWTSFAPTINDLTIKAGEENKSFVDDGPIVDNNKFQVKVSLVKDEAITVLGDGVVLVMPEHEGNEFVAPIDGEYIIYVNEKNEVYVRLVEVRTATITQVVPETMDLLESKEVTFTLENTGNVAYEDALQIRFQGTNENKALTLGGFKLDGKEVEATEVFDNEKFLGYDILVNVPVGKTITLTANAYASEAKEYAFKTLTGDETSATSKLNVTTKEYVVKVDDANPQTLVKNPANASEMMVQKVALTKGQVLTFTVDGTLVTPNVKPNVKGNINNVELVDGKLVVIEDELEAGIYLSVNEKGEYELWVSGIDPVEEAYITKVNNGTPIVLVPTEGQFGLEYVGQTTLKANDELTFSLGAENIVVKAKEFEGNNVINKDGKLVIVNDVESAEIYLSVDAEGNYQLWVTGYVAPAPQEDKFVVRVNGKETAITSFENGDDKLAFKITLKAKEHLNIELNGELICFGEQGVVTTFVAEADGEHIIYVNKDNRFFVNGPEAEVPQITDLNVTVNGKEAAFSKQEVDPKDELNQFIFTIELKENDEVRVLGDKVELLLGKNGQPVFKASVAGVHTFYVNNKNLVWVVEPVVPEVYNVTIGADQSLELIETVGQYGVEYVAKTSLKANDELSFNLNGKAIAVTAKELAGNNVINKEGKLVIVNEVADAQIYLSKNEAGEYQLWVSGFVEPEVPAITTIKVMVDDTIREGINHEPIVNNNKFQIKVTLAVGEKVTVLGDDDPLEMPQEKNDVFVAQEAGEYIIYVNNKNKVYVVKNTVVVEKNYTVSIEGLDPITLVANPKNESEMMVEKFSAKPGQLLTFKLGDEVLKVVPKKDGNGEASKGNNVTLTEKGLAVIDEVTDGQMYLVIEKNAAGENEIWVTGFVNKDPIIQHEKIYFDPTNDWEGGNARFAAYVFNGDQNAWFDLTKTAGGIYEGIVPVNEKGWTTIIFCRMNPNNKENRWNNDKDTDETKPVWNQTSNIAVVENDLFTLNVLDQWDETKATGEWTKYVAISEIKEFKVMSGDQLLEVVDETIPEGSTDKYKVKVSLTKGQEITVLGDGTALNMPDVKGTTFKAEVDGEHIIVVNDANEVYIVAPVVKDKVVILADGTSIPLTKNGEKSEYMAENLKLEDNAVLKFEAKGITITPNVKPSSFIDVNNVKLNENNELVIIRGGENIGIYLEEITNEKGEVSYGVWVSGNKNTNPIVAHEKLYLDPNANWEKDGAIFKAYLLDDDHKSAWVDLTKTTGGIYEGKIPEGQWRVVIFCRVNPNGTDKDPWKNVWTQTADLEIGQDDLFTINAESWNEGSWTPFSPREDVIDATITQSFSDETINIFGTTQFIVDVVNTGNVLYEDVLQIRFQGTNIDESLTLSNFMAGDTVLPVKIVKENGQFLGYDIDLKLYGGDSIRIIADVNASKAATYEFKTVTSLDSSTTTKFTVTDELPYQVFDLDLGAETPTPVPNTSFVAVKPREGYIGEFKMSMNTLQAIMIGNQDGAFTDADYSFIEHQFFAAGTKGEYTFLIDKENKVSVIAPALENISYIIEDGDGVKSEKTLANVVKFDKPILDRTGTQSISYEYRVHLNANDTIYFYNGENDMVNPSGGTKTMNSFTNHHDSCYVYVRVLNNCLVQVSPFSSQPEMVLNVNGKLAYVQKEEDSLDNNVAYTFEDTFFTDQVLNLTYKGKAIESSKLIASEEPNNIFNNETKIIRSNSPVTLTVEVLKDGNFKITALENKIDPENCNISIEDSIYGYGLRKEDELSNEKLTVFKSGIINFSDFSKVKLNVNGAYLDLSRVGAIVVEGKTNLYDEKTHTIKNTKNDVDITIHLLADGTFELMVEEVITAKEITAKVNDVVVTIQEIGNYNPDSYKKAFAVAAKAKDVIEIFGDGISLYKCRVANDSNVEFAYTKKGEVVITGGLVTDDVVLSVPNNSYPLTFNSQCFDENRLEYYASDVRVYPTQGIDFTINGSVVTIASYEGDVFDQNGVVKEGVYFANIYLKVFNDGTYSVYAKSVEHVVTAKVDGVDANVVTEYGWEPYPLFTIKVTLNKGNKLELFIDGKQLHISGGNGNEYIAPENGEFEFGYAGGLYCDFKNMNKIVNEYEILKNGQPIEINRVDDTNGQNIFHFDLELVEGDVISVNGDGYPLAIGKSREESFTARVNGVHTFTVDKQLNVNVNEGIVPADKLIYKVIANGVETVLTYDKEESDKNDYYQYFATINAETASILKFKNDDGYYIDPNPQINDNNNVSIGTGSNLCTVISGGEFVVYFKVPKNNAGNITIWATRPADAKKADVLYFAPHLNWNLGNERYAAYFYTDASGELAKIEEWQDLTYDYNSNTYMVTVPTREDNREYEHVIFVRFDKNKAENDWNDVWNQTANLNVGYANYYAQYDPDGYWTAYAPVTGPKVIFKVNDVVTPVPYRIRKNNMGELYYTIEYDVELGQSISVGLENTVVEKGNYYADKTGKMIITLHQNNKGEGFYATYIIK